MIVHVCMISHSAPLSDGAIIAIVVVVVLVSAVVVLILVVGVIACFKKRKDKE